MNPSYLDITVNGRYDDSISRLAYVCTRKGAASTTSMSVAVEALMAPYNDGGNISGLCMIQVNYIRSYI